MSFDLWHVTHSPPIGNVRFELGGITKWFDPSLPTIKLILFPNQNASTIVKLQFVCGLILLLFWIHVKFLWLCQ